MTASSSPAASRRLLGSPALPRILPFATLMLLIGVEELCRSLVTRGIIAIPGQWFLYFYLLRIAAAGAVLAFCLGRCDEFRIRDLTRPRQSIASIIIGVVTFALWIVMDWRLPFQAPPIGFNPLLIDNPALRNVVILGRILGATAVIPLIEELFWRSFLLRYLIDADFTAIPPGKLTAPAFIVATVLFGLEHHLIFAGMMAGAVYTLLFRFTGSIAQCVLAHAVTNLALGAYVLLRQAWHFW